MRKEADAFCLVELVWVTVQRCMLVAVTFYRFKKRKEKINPLSYIIYVGVHMTLMPPPHLALPKSQGFSLKLGKAPLVIAEASGYPDAPTRTGSGDSQVGFG